MACLDAPLTDGGDSALDLGAALVVVSQVARLAHAHRIELSVRVGTLGRVLISTVLAIARRAHVFGVMLTVGMRAFRNLHHLDLLRVEQFPQLLFLAEHGVLRSVAG